MPLIKPSLVLLFCTTLCACSSGPTEEELNVRVDDLRQRSAQYFNAGSYHQALQQALLGLELVDSDSGELNMLAGHALMMMGDLHDVASAQPYLERACEMLDNYRADLLLGEFHQRYGSMLHAHALRLRKSIADFPSSNEEQQIADSEANELRLAKAQQHFLLAIELFLVALKESPDDLYALQLIGSSYSLTKQPAPARVYLNQAIDILVESRQYKNRVIVTDTKMDLRQESRLRNELLQDIQTEVAIRMLIAGLDSVASDTAAELAQYTKILGLSPQNLNAIFGRGLCHYKLGNFHLATADFDYFIANTPLGFDHPQVRRAFKIIEETSL
ncbi:MAG: hypothetical protein H8E25_15060 [Planctomycetes bacterium]|nr:hypothetical protein [Planctomycetota bacterium]